MISKNLHETIWKPVLYKPYKIHQAGQPNSGDETSISLDSEESEEEAENLAELRDISSNLQAEELLEILINALDLQSAEELLKILTEQKDVGIEKRNFMRSISEDPREESQENVGRAKEESEVEQNPEEGNYQDALRETKGEEGETSSGEAIAQDSGDLQVHLKGAAKLRNRRDIDGEIEKDYSDWLPPLFMRKARRAIKKTGQNNNFLCLRENQGGTSDEDASKFFKIVKENEYYKAVPINKPPKELNRRILPITRSRSNDDHPGEKIDFPGRLKIVSPAEIK